MCIAETAGSMFLVENLNRNAEYFASSYPHLQVGHWGSSCRVYRGWRELVLEGLSGLSCRVYRGEEVVEEEEEEEDVVVERRRMSL